MSSCSRGRYRGLSSLRRYAVLSPATSLLIIHGRQVAFSGVSAVGTDCIRPITSRFRTNRRPPNAVLRRLSTTVCHHHRECSTTHIRARALRPGSRGSTNGRFRNRLRSSFSHPIKQYSAIADSNTDCSAGTKSVSKRAPTEPGSHVSEQRSATGDK